MLNSKANPVLQDVQILRGISVILVVLFHYTDLLPGGYVGVDVFFVISGFVLSRQFETLFQSRSFGEMLYSANQFLRRRFFRLFPAFLLLSSLSIFLLAFFSTDRTVKVATRQFVQTLLGVGNVASYSLSGDYFNPEPNALIHLWSLSAEVQIYLFVLLLAVLSKLLRISFTKFLYLLFFFSIGFWCTNLDKLVYETLGILSPNDFGYYSPISHLWQFLAGIIVARKGFLRTDFCRRIPLVFFLVALLFVSRLMIGVQGQVVSAGITLLALLFSKSVHSTRMSLLLAWLGDRSYSIYLLHLPIYFILEYALISLPLRGDSFLFFFASTLTLIFGSLSYKYVELGYRETRIPRNSHSLSIKMAVLIFTSLVLLSFSIYDDDARETYSQSPREGLFRDPFSCKRDNEFFITCGKIESEKRLLVVGDSHAGAIFDSIKLASSFGDYAIDVSVLASCPFFKTQQDSLSNCAKRNLSVKSRVESTEYVAVFSTFRNPNFSKWTPGAKSSANYSIGGLFEGIDFLNSNSDLHVFFTPNSEFTGKTRFMGFLDDSLRVKSQIPDFSELFVEDRLPSRLVNTDYAMCGIPRCSITQLELKLGDDGNHIGYLGQKAIASFLDNEFKSYKE